MVRKMIINGEPKTIQATTLSELLMIESIDPAAKFIAVAINGSVILRQSWSITQLKSGDSVEIVQPAPGG